MKRVMIVGQPGAGKSTLARLMGTITGLPVVHIDRIHWMPGWIERTGPEKDRLCAEVHARDEWIFEGGRSPTWPERLDRADTLIWLDPPFALRVWRVFRRTVRDHGRVMPDKPEDCPERFDLDFARWIWTTRHSHRAKMRALWDGAPPGKAKYRFTNAGDVDGYLRQLGERYGS